MNKKHPELEQLIAKQIISELHQQYRQQNWTIPNILELSHLQSLDNDIITELKPVIQRINNNGTELQKNYLETLCYIHGYEQNK